MKRIIILSLIFLIACTTLTPIQSEIEIVAATSTAISIPTFTPTPEPTPAGSYDPTLVPVPTSLALADITARLADLSRRYVAEDEPDAIKIAQALGFLGADGHPANMCGPLSAAELRDVGLLPDYVNLHDFWLLDPRDKRYILDQFFPSEYFSNYFFETPIHRFNFNEFPLKVGDFVYIYQGGEGNFEHMLVVTRVDDQSRAYSVTNIHTWDDKYIITEALLYDPNNVGVGQFYDWTTLDNPIGMVTGYGGFEVWRPIKSPRVPSVKEKAFAIQMDALFKDDPTARVLITRGNDILYASHSYQPANLDEAIYLSVALLLFKALDANNVAPAEYRSYLTANNLNSALRAMLVDGDQTSVEKLLAYIRAARVDWRATLKAWGATTTDLDYRRTSAADVALLLSHLYAGDILFPEARQIILGNLAEGGLSSIATFIESNGQVYKIVLIGGEGEMEKVISVFDNFLKEP